MNSRGNAAIAATTARIAIEPQKIQRRRRSRQASSHSEALPISPPATATAAAPVPGAPRARGGRGLGARRPGVRLLDRHVLLTRT
ncbi:hypothetical protein [Actinomadura madurae]|uniref:hypothetical protein n=1 Tax=Actinomadura madurae TaxID=1993 RepID=UPI0020D234A4|nr:hypothetical protein [Actinomadura madurae]MCQ0021375.1 hypothetical protein [Actinomadura madurae]